MKKSFKIVGFSLLELVVGMGITAIIALNASNLMTKTKEISKKTEVDSDIEDRIFELRKMTKNTSKCNQIVAGATNSNNFTFSISGKNFGPSKMGVNLELKSIVSFVDVSQKKGTVNLKFNFEKTLSTKKTQISRNIIIPVVRDKNNTLKCQGIDESSISNEGPIKVCESLGGVFSNNECNFDTGLSDDLKIKAKEFLCQSLGGTLLNNVCDKIVLEQNLVASNISPSKICLGSDCRTKFDNTECTSGFLVGLSVDGQTKKCRGLTFAKVPNSCTPNCSCASNTASDKTCFDGCTGSCKGLDCDYLDNYKFKGTRPTTEEGWAKGTQVCEFINYSDLSVPGTCRESGRIPMNAGECKKFKVDTCNLATTPIIENVVDGTACGSNKECKAGICEDIATPGCWVPIAELDTSPNIHGPGYPSAKWVCDTSPFPTANGILSSFPGTACPAVGQECEYNYKYGSKTYSCKTGAACDYCALHPGACGWWKDPLESEVGNRGCSWGGDTCSLENSTRVCQEQPRNCPRCVVDPIVYECKRK